MRWQLLACSNACVMFATTWIRLEAMSTRRSTGTGVGDGLGGEVGTAVAIGVGEVVGWAGGLTVGEAVGDAVTVGVGETVGDGEGEGVGAGGLIAIPLYIIYPAADTHTIITTNANAINLLNIQTISDVITQ
jgi:hypothetical protein